MIGIPFEGVRNAVQRAMNVLYRGVPGCGKTYTANCDARALIGLKNTNRILQIDFGENLDYSYTMIGQRQNEKGLWRYVRGQIVKFCDFANQYKDKQFVLILNELTRANTEAVLGQLFTAMENKYRRQEYYVLGIYGIGYQLRYSNKEYGRQALFYTNMSSFKGATTKELRQALYYRVYRTTLELTNKGINIAINVNRMILKLINLIKENSDRKFFKQSLEGR